jgi:hypothetical protein
MPNWCEGELTVKVRKGCTKIKVTDLPGYGVEGHVANAIGAFMYRNTDLVVGGYTQSLLGHFAVSVTSGKPKRSVKAEVLDRITLKPEHQESYLDATKIILPKDKDDRSWRVANWGTKWGVL